MKLIFSLILFLLISISSCQSNIELEIECDVIRNGTFYKKITKSDVIESSKGKILSYTSKINDEKPINRQWQLQSYNSKWVKIHEFEIDNSLYTSKIIALKNFVIEGKHYKVIKYRIDELLSRDEESNKFYTSEFGIILETYWKRNYIKATSIKNKDNNNLNVLVERILEDEEFVWRVR